MRFTSLVALALLATFASAEVRPPHLSVEFVWVPKHQNAKGVWIDGHWVHPKHPHRIWIPAHTGPHGKHIPGHWVVHKP